jgi:hypothetical protein
LPLDAPPADDLVGSCCVKRKIPLRFLLGTHVTLLALGEANDPTIRRGVRGVVRETDKTTVTPRTVGGASHLRLVRPLPSRHRSPISRTLDDGIG